ncbi:MAG: cytochrome c maturation protein CcmE [Gammaproteobacteria bacterium]|nr:cytochrome c maturation protein CcmE [Gammaproteobacteria bacterium]
MRRDRRFFAGLVGVAAVVSYLIYTGISDTMVYYLTPAELLTRIEVSPETRDQGVKVSGMLVPGSYANSTDELLHTFVVEDPDDTSVRMAVEFRHPLPDTFDDSGEVEVEVVMQGRYRPDGVFEATEVLTKCGSRYEAMPEMPQQAGAGAGYGGLIG